MGNIPRNNNWKFISLEIFNMEHINEVDITDDHHWDKISKRKLVTIINQLRKEVERLKKKVENES